MKEIAIIGLGWLGLPLAKKIRSSGFNVLGTTTSKDKIEALRAEGLDARLLNLNMEIEEEEFIRNFSHVSICVLTIPPSKSLFQTYQSQCLKLISLFPESTKFIFTSATSVYTDSVKIAFEDSQILSDFAFSSQLFLTEKALKQKLKERITILRLGGLFGENRNPAKFLAGKKELKNPQSPVNLVHRDDVVNFIIKVIEQNSWGETFNVCSSEHPSRKEFYTWMCQKENLELPHFEDNTEIHKQVSNEKGKKALNFKYNFDSPFDF